MKLEAVRAIAVGDPTLEVSRQINDLDSIEGTFLWADPASDAE